MRNLVVLFALLLPLRCLAAPQCASEAIAQAQRLLAFHTDGDQRPKVESVAVELPPIRNPANKKQVFSVLEVNGYVYKGEYRMRLIYYRSGGGCLLMGQEILERASL